VIIPALTFVADINVVRMVGATPILADCGGYNDWNITAQTIKEQISSRTKAVILVHLLTSKRLQLSFFLLNLMFQIIQRPRSCAQRFLPL